MNSPRVALILVAAVCALLPVRGSHAAVAGPSIKLTRPASPVFETADASLALAGSGQTERSVAAVRWVDQSGHRGSGTWTENSQHGVAWSVAGIALRPGVNLIAVSIVDAANSASTLHLVVNRKATVAPALPIGHGVYQNRPVVYQRWHGNAVLEGDIIMPLSSFTPPDPGVTTNGLGISDGTQLWSPVSGGAVQVPYLISGGTAANLTTALTAFNQTFAGLIQFVSRTAETNYVNIVVESGGSTEGYSNEGMAGNEQTLECGSGCTVATWLHEMGHTVGLLHEHQRPDRAKYLTLTLGNADLPNVPGNFTLFSFDYQTLGLYDYASVMHYGAFNFSEADQPVMESIPAGIPLSNELGYSAGDVDQVKRLYGAAPSAVTVTTNPSGLNIIVDGTTYTAPQSFSFALNSTHTVALPADPQFTSPADGSTYAFGNWNDLGASSHTITVSPGTGALTSPTSAPAVTLYEANYIRLQPFGFLAPAAYPAGSGAITTTPKPTAEFGGNFFTDRTLVKLTLTAGKSYDFYDWFNLPFPASDNPHMFYIQAPTTQAQAVLEPKSKPVTIVGESITGPNTWNPGISGFVDGAFAFLPQGYTPVYNSGWGAGTVHAIEINTVQSPVTTNVYYNWNRWSDGGSSTHNITQPATGSQTVTASLTPFYATYTSPGPLGSNGGSCAGGVATSPAGISYQFNPTFLFYEDGTSVTTTATPNPAFPAMLFAGWAATTEGLTGKTNPDTVTVHEQFVPTGNFNVTATPLKITTLTPASVKAGAGALAITVTGTGFTPKDTFAYWNGANRTLTYKSATQVVMRLKAGDLNQAGGQDVSIGNYTTVSAATCGVTAETSFTVLD